MFIRKSKIKKILFHLNILQGSKEKKNIFHSNIINFIKLEN